MTNVRIVLTPDERKEIALACIGKVERGVPDTRTWRAQLHAIADIMLGVEVEDPSMELEQGDWEEIANAIYAGSPLYKKVADALDAAGIRY